MSRKAGIQFFIDRICNRARGNDKNQLNIVSKGEEKLAF